MILDDLHQACNVGPAHQTLEPLVPKPDTPTPPYLATQRWRRAEGVQRAGWCGWWPQSAPRCPAPLCTRSPRRPRPPPPPGPPALLPLLCLLPGLGLPGLRGRVHHPPQLQQMLLQGLGLRPGSEVQQLRGPGARGRLRWPQPPAAAGCRQRRGVARRPRPSPTCCTCGSWTSPPPPGRTAACRSTLRGCK